jgi:hypothetical protein
MQCKPHTYSPPLSDHFPLLLSLLPANPPATQVEKGPLQHSGDLELIIISLDICNTPSSSTPYYKVETKLKVDK